MSFSRLSSFDEECCSNCLLQKTCGLQRKRLYVLPTESNSAPAHSSGHPSLDQSSSTEYQTSLGPPDHPGKPAVEPRTLEETKLQELLIPDKAGRTSLYSWIHKCEKEGCLKIWLLFKVWLMSYKLKKFKIRVSLVLKFAPIIFNT